MPPDCSSPAYSEELCRRLGQGTVSYSRKSAVWSLDARAALILGLPFEATKVTAQEFEAVVAPADLPALSRFLASLSETAVVSWRGNASTPGRNAASFELFLERASDGSGDLYQGAIVDRAPVLDAERRASAANEKARRYQTMFMLSSSLQALVDEMGFFALVTPQWTNILGWPEEQLVTGRMEDFLAPEDASELRELLANGVELGSTLTSTSRFTSSDGGLHWFALTITRDAQSELLYVVAQDVTALKEAEALLRKREEALRQTGDLARVGGWEYLVAQRTFHWSESLCRVLEVPFGQPQTLEQALEFFVSGAREGVRAAMARAERGEGGFDLEVPVTRANGEPTWLRMLGQVEQQGGRVVRLMGAAQDVTEQRSAREEVLAASRAKSQFLATMSHEVRTPLNGIIGMTQLALETSLTPEQHEYLEAVRTSGQNLLAIVNDLLDLSKIESGKLSLERIEFDLDKVLHNAIRNQAVRAHAAGLELVLDIEPDVSPRVWGDPLRVGQVVTNLIGNAVKFTAQGEVVVTVRRGAEPDVLEFSVRDTGIGVAPDRREAIFEAFTQADQSTSRQFGGTGLGLTICRELVARMGGHISVHPSSPRGSLFRFSAALPKAGSARRRGDDEGVGHRVLLVDDNDSARKAIADGLRARGVFVVDGPSIDLATSALSEAGPPLDTFTALVIDHKLPGHSGLELFDALGPPVGDAPKRYLLVDTTQRPTAEAVARVQVARTFTKPVLASEIMAAIATQRSSEGASGATSSGASSSPRLEVTVLLAEDNPINARLASHLLKKLGATVVLAGNGEFAVEAWKKGGVDVILMDVQMPVVDGLEATRRIRAQEAGTGQRVPILALTANAMAGDDVLCRDAGMDDYLTKPLDPERLTAQLRAVVGRRSQAGSGR